MIQAREEYHIHQPEISTLVQQLFENYRKENIAMPYTIQDYQRDYVREHLDLLPPEEVLQRYTPEEVLRRYSPADRLKNLSPEDRLKGLSPEEIQKALENLRQYHS